MKTPEEQRVDKQATLAALRALIADLEEGHEKDRKRLFELYREAHELESASSAKLKGIQTYRESASLLEKELEVSNEL